MSTSKPLLPRTSTVRIPLDYYQILGVSFDATPEQIQQSFEDRLQQLPKQQFSSFALTARKKLLQEAHGILLNPKRRQEHDQGLFPDIESPSDGSIASAESAASAVDPDAFPQGIEIDTNHLAGALILLLEFGKFDEVLALGLDHLNRPIDLEKMPSEVGPNDDDVALAVAIANLELGREHWQQGDCEDAGQCLQTGLKILKDEGKFLDIQAEIETDLSKLRPYRVLNLLALDLEDPRRAEGLSLLQNMLDDRGGLEGDGNDKSGLSVNNFLLFIQQLRDTLTVNEQLNLFKAEAMRPSSVASYLSVYAHVAKGVSDYDPPLISQAKALLSSLSDRQDLTLEQGMCSLLLGQPDAAAHCVEQSSDEEALSFIRDYSDGAPDILPGLYLYTEQWLQQEVYPYFRDLGEEPVALEAYFNDVDVQRQLSDLEPDLPQVNSSWSSHEVDEKWQQWLEETTQGDNTAQDEKTIVPDPQPDLDPKSIERQDSGKILNPSNWFAALTPSKPDKATEDPVKELQWSQPLPPEDTVSQPVTPTPIQPQKPASLKSPPSQPLTNKRANGQETDVSFTEKQPPRTIRSSTKKPWVIWAAALLLGVSVVWGAIAIGKLVQSSPVESEVNPDTTVSQSPDGSNGTTIPPSTSDTAASSTSDTRDSALTTDAAQEIVRAWQQIKSEALGKNYQVDQLSQILVEPELSRWQYSADVAQEEKKYTTYNLKDVKIESVTMDSATVALVRATIAEKRDEYNVGNSTPFASLDDVYKVDYRLESVDGKWRIKEMKVVD